ncbi:MAG: DNA polymerase III subunit delta [Ruminococcaceae bacterium]|nr:DNA polymerase III subunit delta [Oscillospiraceae bacterium]
MAWNEETLKQHIKNEELLPVYVLYGEESYLVGQYASKLCRRAMDGEDELDSFNLHRFDGLKCDFNEIEEAAEALPLMAERTCVTVRDYDVGTGDGHERLLTLLQEPNESCVLIFYYDAMKVSAAKNERWKTFLAAAEKSGAVVKLDKRTPEEVARMLVSGATRRGCSMKTDTARLLLEWCGNDLNLLMCELDKLAALADGGEIDRGLVERAATRNLESRVFELSKAILKGQYTAAYEVLHALFAQKEDPIMINGVLASAWADLYRVKTAEAAGQQPTAVAAVYAGYKGKEFRLRNAARDASRLSAATLREGLEVLAEADRRLKFTPADNHVVLEETAARLILLTRRGN